ncbi:MAG: hypothetical protein RIS35_2805 [Pseudomonadota bacterium]
MHRIGWRASFFRRLSGILLSFAALLAAPLALGEQRVVAPKFGLPIRCEPGRDCFVQNYFDRDPGPGWRDFACGALSYDGHHGTDFRLPSLARMAQGVAVLAAAPGRVAAVRDGEPDVSVRERGLEAVKGREAGNAVRIDHGNGWQTQYSHLRRGSVRVRPGQWVEAGEELGLVGLSGKTEFPHVDFVVRHQGRPLDPYAPALGPAASVGGASDPVPGAPSADTPAQASGDCRTAPADTTLWRDELRDVLRYVPSGVLVSGFALGSIDRERAQREESVDTAETHSPAIFFFVEVFGLRGGDVERISIEAPDGRRVLSNRREVERNQAVRYLGVGARVPASGWMPGRYLGRYELERAGVVVAQVQRGLVIQ